MKSQWRIGGGLARPARLLRLGAACLTLAASGTVSAQPGNGDPGADRSDADEPLLPLDVPEPSELAQVIESADPEPDDGEAGADEAEPAVPEGRLETLVEVERLVEEERYADALPAADRLVELTEQEFGADSMEAAEAWERVARIQRLAEEHELAETSYLRAVDLIRENDGTFSEQAIAPLVGLGDNYHSAGEYLSAITAYDEARTVSRRVFGLLNEGQVPILERITDSFEALEQYAEADEQQLEILHLAERNHEEASPQHLDAIYRYGGWLRESGRFHEERSQYSRAMRLIRDRYGSESVQLVRPLREMANSFRSQRLPDNQAMSSLRSALELIEQADDADPVLEAEVLRDMGDWEVAFARGEPELDAYREAWAALGEAEDGDELRAQWFGELQNVLREPISQRGLSREPDAAQGYVIVRFDLDRHGRTENVEVARSDPAGYKDDAVVRAVDNWRFRPFMENGEIVSRSGLALRFNYRYMPDEDEE